MSNETLRYKHFLALLRARRIAKDNGWHLAAPDYVDGKVKIDFRKPDGKSASFYYPCGKSLESQLTWARKAMGA